MITLWDLICLSGEHYGQLVCCHTLHHSADYRGLQSSLWFQTLRMSWHSCVIS